MPMYRKINTKFFKKWSPEMAYVLGFFAADGSMLKNTRGGHFIEFHITDYELLYGIRTLLRSNHKIAVRDRHNKKWKLAYRLQIGSKEMFDDLMRLGFTQAKSHTLQMPKIPKKFQGDFVRGYFDGDGCVYFKRLKFADRRKMRWILSTLFTCGSKHFLISLHELLKNYGVRGGSLRQKKRGYDLSLSFKDSLALFKFMYHTTPATNLYLPRKRNIFLKALRIL